MSRSELSNYEVISQCENIPQDTLTHEILIHQWRMKTELSIFRTVSFSCDNCEDQTIDLTVNVQKEEILLKDFHVLSLVQALSILRSVLFTAERLSIKFGYFSITDKMIGFLGNETKLWINENYAKNKVMKMLLNEKEAISDVLFVLKNHSENSFEDMFFAKGKKCSSFLQINEYLWKFIYEKQLFIPPTIHFFTVPLPDILRKGKKKKSFFSYEKDHIKEDEVHSMLNLNSIKKFAKKIGSSFEDFDQINSQTSKQSQNGSLELSFEYNYSFNPSLESIQPEKHFQGNKQNFCKMKTLIQEKMKKRQFQTVSRNCLSYFATVKSIGQFDGFQPELKENKPLKYSELGKTPFKNIFQSEYSDQTQFSN